jgi:hypothetical protein
VRDGEVGAVRSAAPVKASIGPSWLLGDRKGVGWAGIFLFLARLRHNRNLLIGGNLFLLLAMPFLFLGIVVDPTHLRVESYYWLPFLALFSLSWLRLEHPQRLFLLGVPYRAQLLQRLRTFWATPLLLLCLLFLAPAALISGVYEAPLALTAAALALTLFQAGWWEWPSQEVGPGWLRAFWLTAALGLLAWVLATPTWFWLPEIPLSPAQRLLLFAVVVAALGLAAIGYKLARATEERLQEAYVN